MLGLYVHVPFCNQICPYCDFYKLVSNRKRKIEYVDALCKEMNLKKLSDYQFDSVYIGGGSPSCLDLDLLELVLNNLKSSLASSDIKEFTVEVNPSDITYELVKLFKKNHVTRVSIGVETLEPRLQELLKRPLGLDELKSKINLLKENGIDNINIDLMYAIPSETFFEFDNDLKKVVNLDITHISVYSLILEEHTVFYHNYLKGNLELVDEKLENKMYHHLCNTLKKAKFNHYETSNFAKKGYESIHNLIYWNCDEYIAIGPSASSYHQNYRFTNTKNLRSYIEGLNKDEIILSEKDYISKEEAMKEEIILGLRKCQGVSIKRFFEKFNLDIFKVFPKINDLLAEKLLIKKGNYIYIPKKYFYISNHIIVKII